LRIIPGSFALLNEVTDAEVAELVATYEKEYVIADEQKKNEHFNHQVKEAAKAEK
jgi:L-arabinose isomerase